MMKAIQKLFLSSIFAIIPATIEAQEVYSFKSVGEGPFLPMGGSIVVDWVGVEIPYGHGVSLYLVGPNGEEFLLVQNLQAHRRTRAKIAIDADAASVDGKTTLRKLNGKKVKLRLNSNINLICLSNGSKAELGWPLVINP